MLARDLEPDVVRVVDLRRDAEEGFVLSRIGDRATVREVLLVSGMRKERGYQVLWNLIRKGYVKARRQS